MGIEHTTSRDEFINAMRRVAACVTVVTTDGSAGRLGATVRAFSSVSADPPTILVCLRANSRIAGAVSENQAFCVNVLAEKADGIADRFAGAHDKLVSDRFMDVACRGDNGIPPEIIGATVFACIVDQIVTSGSHLVVFGRVQKVHNGDIEPLAYLDGAYHSVTPKPVQNFGKQN